MIRKIKDKNIKIIGSGFDSGSSNSTTNTLLKSVFVEANTFKEYDRVYIRTLFRKSTTNSNTYTVYLYWNTTNALDGNEILMATYNVGGTEPSPKISRSFVFRNNDTIDIMNTSFSSLYDLGDFNTTGSNPAVKYSVDGYFIASAIRTSGGSNLDNILCSYLTVEV